MKAKNRIRRSHLPPVRASLSSVTVESIMPDTSFHAALAGCSSTQMGRWSPLRDILSLFRPSDGQPKPTGASTLIRTWEWMHAKYTLSAAKRLRVSDTVSLGEKRFVAIVTVEGREFLIGGGSSGISLLARLGSTSPSEDQRLQVSGVDGRVE